MDSARGHCFCATREGGHDERCSCVRGRSITKLASAVASPAEDCVLSDRAGVEASGRDGDYTALHADCIHRCSTQTLRVAVAQEAVAPALHSSDGRGDTRVPVLPCSVRCYGRQVARSVGHGNWLVWATRVPVPSSPVSFRPQRIAPPALVTAQVISCQQSRVTFAAVVSTIAVKRRVPRRASDMSIGSPGPGRPYATSQDIGIVTRPERPCRSSESQGRASIETSGRSDDRPSLHPAELCSILRLF
jgi:hypothetical protein